MKHLAPTLFLAISTLAHGNELTALDDLADLQWKNRIVIINEPENEEDILALLDNHAAETNDRDIIWFIFKQDRLLTNYSGRISDDFRSKTREKYDIMRSKVILIGKDGGLKSRYNRFDPGAVFSDIDAMPMRQYEMRNQPDWLETIK